MNRLNRVLFLICAIATMFNLYSAIAYSNRGASTKNDEPPKIVQGCFDNIDRYYTHEGYR